MRRNRYLQIALAILVLIFLPACGLLDLATREATPSSTPARTLRPTFTPTAPATATSVPAATVTPSAEAIVESTATEPAPTLEPPTTPPTQSAQAIVQNPQLNVRSGPGTAYPVIGQASSGDQFRITGKTAAGNWWQIDYLGRSGWVTAGLVSATGDVASVQPVRDIPTPPPTPTAPSPTPTITPTQTPSPTPRPGSSYAYQAGSMTSAAHCDALIISGKVIDAGGSPLDGVTVELRYGNDIVLYGQSGQGAPAGEWRFTPLSREFMAFPMGFTVRLIRSQASPIPLSDDLYIDYRDCSQAGQFTNITFRLSIRH